MKNIAKLFSLTLLLTWTSHAQAQRINRKLRKSEARWQQLKTKAGNTYSFMLHASAHGRKISTTIVVKAGKIAAALQTISVPGKPTQRAALSQLQLNNTPTLDQIYANITHKILPKAGKNLKLSFNKQGLLQEAGYERVGCKGDCYEGYQISHLTTGMNIKARAIISWVKWENQKTAWNNNYVFVRHTQYKAGAIQMRKTITVRQGKVIKVVELTTGGSRRLYTKVQRRKTPTLDTVYLYALETLPKVSATKNKLYFKTVASGLVSLVGSSFKNCVDDCFNGYEISDIRGL